MAMGSTGGGDGLSSDINVTPLIDVLLVLLIIFMITQPMSRKAFDVQVPPKQQQKTKEKPSSQIVLELKADGSYAINGQPYSVTQLDQAFHQVFDPRPAKLLFVKAAPNRKYGEVLHGLIFVLVIVRGRELLQRLPGAPGRGGGGEDGSGRPHINFFTLPAAGPTAVDVPATPAVAFSDLRALPPLKLDLPPLEVPH